MVNFELKRNKITEDKKMMKGVVRCFEMIYKSYLELQEMMQTKV